MSDLVLQKVVVATVFEHILSGLFYLSRKGEEGWRG